MAKGTPVSDSKEYVIWTLEALGSNSSTTKKKKKRKKRKKKK
jgi:hypothetical protein